MKKRYDIVGSFLRPAQVLQARKQHSQGQISDADLRQVVDQAIRELVAKQVELDYGQVTDGEVRRTWWHLDFFWGLTGIEAVNRHRTAANFHLSETEVKYQADSLDLVAKLSGSNHPFIDDFIFLRDVLADYEGVDAKLTLPSPARLYYDLTSTEAGLANVKRIYPNKESLFEDIQSTYQTVLEDLYQAGARFLQFDDPIWITLVDRDRFEKIYAFRHEAFDPLAESLAEDFVQVNNAVLKGRPDDLVIATHNCRGNFRSQWASQGAYDAIAPYAFAQQDFDRQFLEYDTDRAGGFEALREVPNSVDVVLGLVTSKQADLEDPDTIIQRVEEASHYHPLDKLYLSPQCGFASTEEGNLLTEADQWQKLAHIRDIARRIWSDADHVH